MTAARVQLALTDVKSLAMIYPVFQPIVDIQLPRVAWRESLARVRDGNHEHGAMLAIAEHFGIIQHIDLAMLSQVIGLLPWLDTPTSVNLSSQTVEYGSNVILEVLQERASVREKLIFEITEVSPILNIGRLLNFRRCLRDLNVSLAIDDYGTGIWTDQLVALLEPDIVKVSWASGAVDAALDIARQFSAEVVVEFVDTAMVLSAVRSKGVRFVQGYLFGKPSAFSADLVLPPFVLDQEILCEV